jgi:hypothetical protein
MHDAIMAEFSDSHTDAPVETETSWEGVAIPDPDLAAVDDIAMVEILSQPQGAESIVEA